MKKILILIVTTCLFAGCYTDKKATYEVMKAIEKKPAIAAKLTRAAFPCIIKKRDTTISVTDTTIMIDCPDSIYTTPAAEYFTLHDTAVVVKTRTVKVPVKLPQVTRYIETFIEDSAKIEQMQFNINVQAKQIIEKDQQIKSRNKFILWLLILCAILAVGNFIQFKKII